MSTAPAPAAMPARPKVRPSVGWIVLAIVLLIGGPGGCTAVLITQTVGLLDDFDEFGRVELPTEGTTIRFDTPVADAALFVRGATTDATALLDEVTLTDPDGESVPLGIPGETFTASHPDGGELRLAYRFTISEPGDYELSATVRRGGEGLQLFVGRYNLATFGKWLAGGIALGALAFVLGLITLIVVIVRRRRARNALAAPAGWGNPPPGWGPPGSPPPPQGWGQPAAPPTQPEWGQPAAPPPQPGWGEPAAPPPPPGWVPAPSPGPDQSAPSGDQLPPMPPAQPGDQP